MESPLAMTMANMTIFFRLACAWAHRDALSRLDLDPSMPNKRLVLTARAAAPRCTPARSAADRTLVGSGD